jgi:hypothetical protein
MRKENRKQKVTFYVTASDWQRLETAAKAGRGETPHLAAREIVEASINDRDGLLEALNLLSVRIHLLEEQRSEDHTELEEFREAVHTDLQRLFGLIKERLPKGK